MQTIYNVRDLVFEGEEAVSYSKYEDPLILIDNGSWQCRAGYASEKEPRMVFDSVVSSYRDRRQMRTYTLVGNDTLVEPMVRQIAKSPFDYNVVANWDVMVRNSGVSGCGQVEHPLLMTEPVCNPSYNRGVMSELLFECYSVPSLCYGIDSLFSFYYNGGIDGIVVSVGNNATHVIPVLKGCCSLSASKRYRISWGGIQSTEYLLKLFQLKYPNFPQKMTFSQAQCLLHDHTYVSLSYSDEIKRFLDPEVLAVEDRIIQFPCIETPSNLKTEEELARLAEKRREAGRRLQKQAQKTRLEKLVQKEKDMVYYIELQEAIKSKDKKFVIEKLESEGFADEMELASTIKRLETAIKRAKNKDSVQDSEAPSFPLLDVPDSELDEAGLKQKKHQKLMKSNYEARMRVKAEKQVERARNEERERLDEEKRLNNLENWLEEKRKARNYLLEKIREKKKLKADLNNRKSMANQMRMKSIASLASDQSSRRKRRKANDVEDTFGANDEDWAIYRDIVNTSESEEDNNNLQYLESQLMLYDPTFAKNDASDLDKDPTKSWIHMFYRGVYPPFDPNDVQQLHQLHLNVERIRVPEIYFDPNIAGLDQASVIEVISGILSRFDINDSQRMANDIFCTGGASLLKNFSLRIEKDFRALWPVDKSICVRHAKDPLIDAWRGMQQWCHTEEYKKSFVTKQEYSEMGSEYMKEHGMDFGVYINMFLHKSFWFKDYLNVLHFNIYTFSLFFFMMRSEESPMDFTYENPGLENDANSPFSLSNISKYLGNSDLSKKRTFFETSEKHVPSAETSFVPVGNGSQFLFSTPKTIPNSRKIFLNSRLNVAPTDSLSLDNTPSYGTNTDTGNTSADNTCDISKNDFFSFDTKNNKISQGVVRKVKKKRMSKKYDEKRFFSGNITNSDDETVLSSQNSRFSNWFINYHRDIPYIASGYMQLTIQRDVDQKVEEYSAEILQEMSLCSKEYSENRCSPDHRVPAMERACITWEKCMNRDPTVVGRAKVSAETFAEIINSFIDPISYKTMIFCILIVFGSVFVSNFAFGFFRAKSINHPHPYIAAAAPHFDNIYNCQKYHKQLNNNLRNSKRLIYE
ncbi:hypothetical protein PORY_001889 [Pneumocystis oryctolagi]|uniref:Uncharacterized protein n=1 Tax=Pneumocystis oryctolagi TaxID=42067 RepID=A0ACB7CB56_9ASCO|nr:hypothetical protein PORY_001889 [Pneumocystis oryctolagi]